VELSRARSLLLVPGPLAEEILRLSHDWVAAWVADPFLVVVLGDGSITDAPVAPDVRAVMIGRDGSVIVDLLDELSERPAALLRIVGISLEEQILGVDTSAVRADAIRLERMLQRSASSQNRISALNLVVSETGASHVDPASLLLPSWDVNVLASPENRSGLESFDAFTRRSRPRDLNGFILAHAITLLGQWSGMASAPYDAADPRRANDGTDLQRISVRGVLAQDFMVQMAQKVLNLLTQEETPLHDPMIRAQLSEQQTRLLPVAGSMVDETVGLLMQFALDDVPGRPLRYEQKPRILHSEEQLTAWESVRRFARFSVDKFRVLPRWGVYRVRTALQRSTGTTLHGEDGDALIELDVNPFGDAAEFQRDIEDANLAVQAGLAALASPPAVTLDGPDTYASLWGAVREGAFRLLDGGSARRTDRLEAKLVERKVDGTLPNTSLVCPDARESWSPHPEVAALVEPDIRDLPMTVEWLDVEEAGRWASLLENLAATYDERVRAVITALELANQESNEIARDLAQCEEHRAAAEALLALNELDHGPILQARIEAALAGVEDHLRFGLVPPTDWVEHLHDAADALSAEDPKQDEAEETVDREGGGEEEVPPQSHPQRPPAFDREAVEAWKIQLGTEVEHLADRSDVLGEQIIELTAERAMLDEVHPIVTDDLLALRAWRWRLERSFAGRLVHELNGERRRVAADQQALEAELQQEHHELQPAGNLYERFVGRMALGFAVAAVLSRLLWEPLLALIGVRYGDGSALVARYLGVPAFPFITLFVLITLFALLDYHRRWSRQRRDLDRLRHDLRQLPNVAHHLQRENLRTYELHRQAREVLRLMSETIHRPFLLDSVRDVLPSSRSLDPRDLPKVVRFARPEVDESWSGEARFVQRILRTQLRPGWRSEAYTRLLSMLQARHGVVRGDLDPERIDRDPVVRTAVIEHLLRDEPQREAGVARVRDVVNDILGWTVEANFPYPKVRPIRVERDALDVRTDMFSDGVEPAEDWQAFLGADVAADERWSPMTFATGFRQEYLERRRRIVHAPLRFHATAHDATTVSPRADEVRPVEAAIRVDVLPEPVATSRMGIFAEGPLPGDDGRASRHVSQAAAHAEVLAAEGSSLEADEGWEAEPDEEHHSFNF
jgi:hypothetical protein